MSMSASEIEKRIKAAIPDARIELPRPRRRRQSLGRHHHLGTVPRQIPRPAAPMVNAAFGADMGTTLHSLAIQTAVPD